MASSKVWFAVKKWEYSVPMGFFYLLFGGFAATFGLLAYTAVDEEERKAMIFFTGFFLVILAVVAYFFWREIKKSFAYRWAELDIDQASYPDRDGEKKTIRSWAQSFLEELGRKLQQLSAEQTQLRTREAVAIQKLRKLPRQESCRKLQRQSQNELTVCYRRRKAKGAEVERARWRFYRTSGLFAEMDLLPPSTVTQVLRKFRNSWD